MGAPPLAQFHLDKGVRARTSSCRVIISTVPTLRISVRRNFCFFPALVLFALANHSSAAQSSAAQSADDALYAALTSDFARLAPQTIRPADGYIRYPYLIPAGYYTQMWDWDGFFIGAHWANQDPADAKYLRDWVLGFASSADANGYVAGCITPKGPRPIFGKFAMKPFLAQGALLASEQLHDYRVDPPRLARDAAHSRIPQARRSSTRAGACGSGRTPCSPAPTTTPRSPTIPKTAAPSSPWMRPSGPCANTSPWRRSPSTWAMPPMRAATGRQAAATRSAILARTLVAIAMPCFLIAGATPAHGCASLAGASFLPLVDGLLPPADARRMIRCHLLNPDEMQSPYGFRSLAKSDPAYNNQAIINPYSNWRGPIWINANFLDWIALRRYGFHAESRRLALTLAAMLHRDIAKWGSMHEDYSAETGEGLAPTVEQSLRVPSDRSSSPGRSSGSKFAGFVGWNLLAQDMLQCETGHGHCMTLSIPNAPRE